jgi:erythromycin esterase
MKKRTRHFKARYIIFAFFGVALLALLVFMRFGGFGTGKTVNVEEFVEYAQPVENLSIPEGKKIIALGGNPRKRRISAIKTGSVQTNGGTLRC